jgi:hypothetical protein
MPDGRVFDLDFAIFAIAASVNLVVVWKLGTLGNTPETNSKIRAPNGGHCAGSGH